MRLVLSPFARGRSRASLALIATVTLILATTPSVSARPVTIGLSSLTSRVEYHNVCYPATRKTAAYCVLTQVSPPASIVDTADGIQMIKDQVDGTATAAWMPDPLDFSRARSITATFSYTVSSTDGYGDGFAFVVQSNGNQALGAWGDYLGYAYGSPMPTPVNPIGTGFAVGLSQYWQQYRVGTDGSWSNSWAMADGQVGHTVVVKLTRSRAATEGALSVTVDGTALDLSGAPVIPWPAVASFVGFTAGTGGASETLTITSFSLTLK